MGGKLKFQDTIMISRTLLAIETSSDLMKLLIGEDVNNSSISAIVEDLSKKNKLKYYGN